MESINNRIKKLREKKGITAAEMAKAIGVPASTYREWEYGRSIRGEPYLKIAAVLNISLYELFTGIAPTGISQKLTEIENIVKELRLQLKDSA